MSQITFSRSVCSTSEIGRGSRCFICFALPSISRVLEVAYISGNVFARKSIVWEHDRVFLMVLRIVFVKLCNVLPLWSMVVMCEVFVWGSICHKDYLRWACRSWLCLGSYSKWRGTVLCFLFSILYFRDLSTRQPQKCESVNLEIEPYLI